MDDIFLSQQKVKLEHEKKHLTEEMKDTSEYPDMGTSDDDREQEVAQFEDNQAVEDTIEKEKEEVEKALQRIEDGTYGKCVKCGGEIPRERLEAYPAADDCIECTTKKS